MANYFPQNHSAVELLERIEKAMPEGETEAITVGNGLVIQFSRNFMAHFSARPKGSDDRPVVESASMSNGLLLWKAMTKYAAPRRKTDTTIAEAKILNPPRSE